MDNFTFEIPANVDSFAIVNYIGRPETDDVLQQELAFHMNDICSTGGYVRFIAKGQAAGMRLAWKEKLPQYKKNIASVISADSSVRSFIVFFEKNDVELLEIHTETWEDDEGETHVEHIYESLGSKLVGDMAGCNCSHYTIKNNTTDVQVQIGF